MGRMTTGLIYGIVIPKDFKDQDEIEEGGIFERYYEKCKDHEKMPERTCGNKPIMGFLVAIDSVKDGVMRIPDCLPVAEIDTRLKRQIASARKRWEMFAKWCAREEGFDLPEPELMIARVDVS